MSFIFKKKFSNTFFLKLLSVLLVAALLASMTLTASAAVVIKTQDAADDFFKDGAIKGIDVSKWQGSIAWNKVANDGINFAFIRSNYGIESDPYFTVNASAAHENGIKVGAYHYARFKSTATMKEEAAAFVAQLKKVKITYPVVLDIENSYGLTKSQLTTLALQFMELIEAEGYPVMIYSYQNFINGHLNINSFPQDSVWVANYKEFPSTIPHSVWQHTSYGTVSGISGKVDINVAHKDLSIRKKIEVDGAISKEIITYINEETGSEIDNTTINMEEINYWAASAIQRDLAYYHDETVEVTGALCSDDVVALTNLSGGDANNSVIIAMIQAKLFYTGTYKANVTGVFDAHTTEAVENYQSNKGLDPSGRLNESTLKALFTVAS